MARHQVHNRRAGKGSGGSAWISYSDIMAALVMVFALFLIFNLYHYNTKIQVQAAKLEEQEGILIIQQGKLDQQSAELENLRIDLGAKEDALSAQTIILIGKQEELDNAKAQLAAKETELASLQLVLNAQAETLAQQEAQLAQQQAALRSQSKKLNTMVGVRSEIVAELSGALAANNLRAEIDSSGNITLESTVFFQTNSSEIRADGQEMLRRFLPVYLEVLLRPEYSDYLGEIIIEGHTDTTGSYINNLKLSQNRALAVAIYCLNIVDGSKRAQLERLLTAKGRSYSDPVYNLDGSVNMDASRRVVFKFSLKDAEMVDELNNILNGEGTSLGELGIE